MSNLKLKLTLPPLPPRKRSSADAIEKQVDAFPGQVPRISKLMALAIRMDKLLRTGEVRDLAELARLGHVSQPRVTQILNLTLLAPEIQEELLHFPLVKTGKPGIHEKMVRPIAAEMDWDRQREMWSAMY